MRSQRYNGFAASTSLDRPRSSAPRYANPERKLQAALVEYFAAAVPRGAALLYAVPNGEKRDEATAAMLTGMSSKRRDLLEGDDALVPAGQGVLAGAPDLVLITDGAGKLARLMRLMRPGVTAQEVLGILGHTATIDLPEIKTPSVVLREAGGAVRRFRGGTLSKAQRGFHSLAERLGVKPVVITTMEEWADLLEARGVRLRSRPFDPSVREPRLPRHMLEEREERAGAESQVSNLPDSY